MILVLCDRMGKSLVKYDLGSNSEDSQIVVSESMTVTSFYVTNDQGQVLWQGNLEATVS